MARFFALVLNLLLVSALAGNVGNMRRTQKQVGAHVVQKKGDPKETFGEGTHPEEFTNEYVPYEGPKTLKEPTVEDKAWEREMHKNIMNYDGHHDYIHDSPRKAGAAQTSAPLLLVGVLVARLFL